LKYEKYVIQVQSNKSSKISYIEHKNSLTPQGPTTLTMEVFIELSYFDIFLHMDVLEFCNFNHKEVKTIFSSIYRINFGNNFGKF